MGEKKLVLEKAELKNLDFSKSEYEYFIEKDEVLRKSNSKAEESNGEAGKLLTATRENEILMQSKGYRTVAEMYLKDDKFKAKNKKGEILVDKDGTPLLKIKNSTGDYKNTTLRKLLIEDMIFY